MCEIAGLLKGAAEGVSKALSETREKLRTETEAVAKVEARLAALESIGCRAVTPNMRGEVTQMRNALLSAETKLKEAENTGGAAALSAATLGGAVEGFVETLFTHQASTAAGKCIVDDSTAASGALGSLTKFIAWGAKAAAGSTPGRGTCATVEVVLKSETAITTNFTEKLDTLSDAIVIKQANAGTAKFKVATSSSPTGCNLFASHDAAASGNAGGVFAAAQNDATGVWGALWEVDSTSSQVTSNGIRIAMLSTFKTAPDVTKVSAHPRIDAVTKQLTTTMKALAGEKGSAEQLIEKARGIREKKMTTHAKKTLEQWLNTVTQNNCTEDTTHGDNQEDTQQTPPQETDHTAKKNTQQKTPTSTATSTQRTHSSDAARQEHAHHHTGLALTLLSTGSPHWLRH
ncbi:hypothetical protein ERJ75_000479700 [Trypanosoma vivax]|nr:hypothetical protein ERJ75_001078800 [Trypanosoma vivax]KAH8616429.1 hypothetical protein ERJ75_000479700 [Trypanosoma vivax]